MKDSNIGKWTVIITTQAGQSFNITSDVPVTQNDAITNALKERLND